MARTCDLSGRLPLHHWSDLALAEALQYQERAPKLTTMGHCANECGMPARGGRTCAACLRAELKLREGAKTEGSTR